MHDLQAEWHGAVPVKEGSFEPLQQITTRWSNRLKQAIAVCHGLTWVNRTMVVGEEMEQRLFKSVEARFKARHAVAVSCLIPCSPEDRTRLRHARKHLFKDM